ncbi:MAG TPA: hypothetical protein VMV72_13905 [Verrucomicrobiae bacterium]|nr:hypothetical protein [Verrucomicrobiae bacterium]
MKTTIENTITMMAALAIALFALNACGQGADISTPPPRAESQSLTAAQTAQVKSILSKYSASTLTVADARAIHEAFRQAGIHGGSAENEAVTAAGFDPRKLRDLDPPPGSAREGEPHPDRGPDLPLRSAGWHF